MAALRKKLSFTQCVLIIDADNVQDHSVRRPVL